MTLSQPGQAINHRGFREPGDPAEKASAKRLRRGPNGEYDMRSAREIGCGGGEETKLTHLISPSTAKELWGEVGFGCPRYQEVACDVL